jgi:O-antigen/teichoic acid export membrane protein
MSIRWVFIKNAIANLGRSGTAAVVALLLPPLLVRHMTSADFGVWVLVLQCASYTAYLDFGLQTAIGRYIAYATEKRDFVLRNSVFSTAFAGLLAVALLSVILLLGIIATIRFIFPSIPNEEIPAMRWSLFILGISLALGLPASAWNGISVGLQRYEIPASTIGAARLLSAIGVVAAALQGKSIVVMATIMALVNVASYLAQYLTTRRIAPDISCELALIRRSAVRELTAYCFGLSVMSFSMLLTTGLDLILVGRFQFSELIPYSVSASLVLFFSGGLNAVLSVIMPHAAALHARQNPKRLGRLVMTSTQVTVVVLIFTGLPLLIYAAPILALWIGPQYVTTGQPILVILLIANMVRLIGAPYAVILIAAGQQRLIKVSPLTEGISNLIASLVLGSMLGAIGVALGTLVGALIGVASHYFYSMPRTNREIEFSRGGYICFCILAPLLAAAPLLAVAGLSVTSTLPLASHMTIFVPASGLSVFASVLLLKRSGIRGTGSNAVV